ncbi:winged helix-turn-helix transcriptional regulator, partial [Candidatus Woesearchaeota archaeon]|nr:winged helix-turn-helix transcriptional regulator [Candidatus Woesearchaeota archaeon]
MSRTRTDCEKAMMYFLRQNSRNSLTRISKKTQLPVSTLYDSLKKLEKEC